MASTAPLAPPARAQPTQRRTKQRPRRQRRGWWGARARIRPADAELLLLIALFGAAMLVRWPYLLRLPHFTDEIGEIRWALTIFRGEQFPLTGQVKYFGPLQHYLLAACMWLFGPSILLPRLLICLIGGLTVVLTYLLGRELGGWRVGALGAALLATLPQHIVVNSHIAWQNSTTPFYSTLCAYAVLRAVRALPTVQPRILVPYWARWLLLAGFVFGLLLQTHIGTLVLAPAFAATFAWGLRPASRPVTTDEPLAALTEPVAPPWRRVLRSPWPYLAGLLAVVAYSPVLIDNSRSGWVGFSRAQGRDYAYVKDPTLAAYLANLRDLAFELMRMLSNPFRIPERPLHYLTSWPMLIAVALCLGGLGLLARRGQILPLAMLVSTAAIMPRFNHAYGVDGDRYLVTGRYVAFLLPPLVVAVAAAALALAGWGLARIPARWRGLRLRDAALLVPVALIALLVLFPLVPLRRYYTHEARLDPDNATFLATVRFVQQTRSPRTPVLIDEFLYKVDLKDGADALRILAILFSLEDIPYRIVPDPGEELALLGPTLDPHDTKALPIVVMMYDRCYVFRDQAPLQQISERYLLRELYWTKPSFYAVYRYAPPPEKAGCYPP